MKNKLFLRIFLTTAAALVVCILIVLVLLSVWVNSYFVDEKKKLLIDNCNTVSQVISKETDNSTYFYVSLNGVINVVRVAVGGEVFTCDKEGNVFICSCEEWKNDNTCVHSTAVIPSDIINKTTDEGYFEVGRFKNRYENIFYTAGKPFYSSDSEIVGYIYISSPASELQSLWNELSNIYLVCTSIPLLLLCIFMFFITKRMVKPINLMSEAAAKMSKGDFSKRIPVGNINDEISNLAESFNTMSNSLSQLEGMRRSFIANVSHELRTPMTTIGGFIDGILDGTIPPEKHNYYLEIVSVEVRRLSRLVQIMLDLAKLESGEKKPNFKDFSLNQLIIDVLVSQEQRISEKDIEIKGLESGKNIIISADRDLLYQAVYNLVDNAIKFTPKGHSIEISVFTDAENKTHFKIKNDGKGIEPVELQYVFEKFYKTDKSRSDNKDGIGLGLYIVKTIVEIHRGKITVMSEPDNFTEFDLIF